MGGRAYSGTTEKMTNEVATTAGGRRRRSVSSWKPICNAASFYIRKFPDVLIAADSKNGGKRSGLSVVCHIGIPLEKAPGMQCGTLHEYRHCWRICDRADPVALCRCRQRQKHRINDDMMWSGVVVSGSTSIFESVGIIGYQCKNRE